MLHQDLSVTGWSNTAIFQNYITKHFANHAGITDRNDQQPTLLLYDGHRSHISITLTDWTKKHKVLLFVLPPHSSHLTQPHDVGIFGPLKNIYNRECSTFMQKNPGMSITKYQVAALTYKPYIKAMSPENLISSFRKTGIFPFNNKVITNDQTAPSIIYTDVQEDENDTHTEEAENNQDKEQQAGEINLFVAFLVTVCCVFCLVTFGCVFFLGFFVDIGVVSLSLDFLADDCKISRLDFFWRSPARYGDINLRLGFFTTNVIVLVSKKLISPACCSLS